ncbi:MAG: hypothetical protein GC191_05690 [Azospirillum sp.]|nr:hypothetical protein [Azospirillum sp.]
MTGNGADDPLSPVALLLDQLELAYCHYDADDRVVAWNRAYLTFFPEHAGFIHCGESYADNLVRFFRSNLPPEELEKLGRHVDSGVARHRAQNAPFVFQRHDGRWLKVASRPTPDGGRLRIWRDVTLEQATVTTGPATAQAVAALDVAFAVFDPTMGFVTGNKRYQELFTDIGDLMSAGRPYRDHLTRIAVGTLAETDAEALLALAERRHPSSEPIPVQRLFQRRDGAWLQLEERRGADGSLVATWGDVTRRAEAEAQVVLLQGRLREAIDTIPHGFVLFDESERVTIANRRLSAIDPQLAQSLVAGAPLEVLAGWRSGLPDGRDLAFHLEALRRPDEPDEFQLPDGRWLRREAVRTANHDLVVLITDVTPERRAADELRQHRDNLESLVTDRTRDLVAARDSAETARAELEQAFRALRDAQETLVASEKMASLGALVAGVSHEINTPLGIGLTGASMIEERLRILSGLVDSGTLKRSQLNEFLTAVREAACLLSANLQRAVELIQNFKQVAVDRASGERRCFDLADYVEEVLGSLGLQLKRTPHTIEIDCPPGIVIDSYPGAVSQILSNFVMNALLHAFDPNRPGRMTVAARLIEDDQVELRFSDNGHGIPQGHLSRIFEPFFTTKRGMGGTGLGLNIVHNLVTGTLKGQISVDSADGRGTSFRITFPRFAVGRDDAKRIATLAAELIAVDGLERACARFREPGTFFFGEIYVNVIDFAGNWLCYPPRPANEGQNVLNRADPDGKPFVREILQIARSAGEGWTDYMWTNPVNGQLQPKTSYVLRVPGRELVVYVGVYVADSAHTTPWPTEDPWTEVRA